jgi:transposase InsO family protein
MPWRECCKMGEPAANNFLQQQEKFDRFIDCYNQERPHQAIGMHYPAEIYQREVQPDRLHR